MIVEEEDLPLIEERGHTRALSQSSDCFLKKCMI